MIPNPWRNLPFEAPFILPEDADFVDDYNKNKLADDDYFIHGERLPEPFQGPGDAPVVLLNLNPAFGEEPPIARDSLIYRLIRTNLHHEPSEYPFYHLHPELTPHMPGFGGKKWWQRHLKDIISEVGHDLVAKGIMCIEYFPYASKKFDRTLAECDCETFKSSDLKNASSFTVKMKNPTDHVSNAICGRLGESARLKLEKWQESQEVPSALQKALVKSLNAIIKGASIWEEGRFTEVTIGRQARELLEHSPIGSEVTRLNRHLLEDAYPLELARKAVLPSMDYSRALVREAIKRKALIVGLRGKKEWEKAENLLINYDRVLWLHPKDRRRICLIKPPSPQASDDAKTKTRREIFHAIILALRSVL